MPSIKYTDPTKTQIIPLIKKITTLGQNEGNDIVIHHPAAADVHAHIVFNGKHFTISALDRDHLLVINGKQKKSHELNHNDKITLGDIELSFSFFDVDVSVKPVETDEMSAVYKTLLDLSAKLNQHYAIAELLENLMDMVISITNADKGFLILLEGEDLIVKVARNLNQENIQNAVSQLSDSIINKVVKTKSSLIVSDALKDQEFNSSLSVINLKLCSVLCVPLLVKGELIGIIYVGNNNIRSLFELRHLEILNIFAIQAALAIKNALLIHELKLDNQLLNQKLSDIHFGEIIGASPSMREIFKRVEKIAGTDVSVLIEGETGTGKELIAKEIHQRSNRRNKPIVTINCGAIPENLLESELFGHVKGSFTGAIATTTGKFKMADSGTLFLDEIGELPLSLQVKILRAIQEKTIVRVGDVKSEKVDIRIIAATNKNLETEIQKGAFREDLYYRLNVIRICLPPLRERGDDVILLAKYFIHKAIKDFGLREIGFSKEALAAIREYAWPGNIRQLENKISKAVIMGEKTWIGPEDLDLPLTSISGILPLAVAREEFQKRYVLEILEKNGGNRTKTAKDLGVDPRTIFRYLEKCGE